MNLLRAANLPVRHCTSFTVHKGVIFSMASIVSGFSLTPLKLTKKPKNFSPFNDKNTFGRVKFHLELKQYGENFFNV